MLSSRQVILKLPFILCRHAEGPAHGLVGARGIPETAANREQTLVWERSAFGSMQTTLMPRPEYGAASYHVPR